jgi:asparagine synthase (glutamine-hydrolysing)
MCGIFGRFARTGPLGDPTPLLGATNRLRHRGPDDGTWWSDGRFFFGHRRLAIIDLSTGEQPMATQDGRLVVSFNGEIYNYVELTRELREKGHRFTTSSDTEVLLHGYREWGTDLPRHLIGMFAFGIADRESGSLFLARDRFGEKPLFVVEDPRHVTFASELKSLSGLPDASHEIDDDALAGYLCLNYVPGAGTLFRSVRRVPPASWRLYTAETVAQGVYWTPPPVAKDTGSVEDALDRLQSALDESIKLALRSDVPVTLFLSGGIDSSVVAESAVRQGKLRHAYCLAFPDARFSEVDKARRVAQALGLELRCVELSSESLDNFEALVDHADDPLADSSGLAVFMLSKAVARDYKVVISGDGGDELFAGYLTYKATALHRRIVAKMPDAARHLLAAAAAWLPITRGKVTRSYQLMRFLRAARLPSGVAHLTWNGTWLPSDAARFAKTANARAHCASVLPRLLLTHGVPASPDTPALQRLDVAEYLCNDILSKVDRMTMAAGLEARAPLLIPAVAELALRLPERLQLEPTGQPKRLLRALAMRHFGSEIGRAKKQGFSIPVHDWLRGPARALAIDLLSPRAVHATGFLDASAVAAALRSHLDGRGDLGFELWGLMVLVSWHRQRTQQDFTVSPTNLRRVGLPA